MSSERPSFRRRAGQMGAAFSVTKAADPRLVPLLLLVAGGVLLVVVLLGVLLGAPVIGVAFGILLAVFSGLLVFGQRSTRVAVQSIEGRPGAAAAVVQSMRGRWRLTPAVAITRKQDFVHLVVGRPGVVLLGEGAPARVSALLKQEHRRLSRAVGEAPLHEVSVGDGAGQVPLRELQAHLVRLPRALKPAEVEALHTRLSALGGSELPVPKGPPPFRGRPR